jgi:dynactin 1
MKDSSKKAQRIGELEKVLEQARRAERELERKLEERTAAVIKSEEEREEWQRKAAEMQAADPSGEKSKRGVASANLVGTSQEMDSLRTNITVLESTIRYLRRQLRRTQAEEAASATSWLSQPLTLPRKDSGLQEKKEKARKAFKAISELPFEAKPVVPGFVADKGREERLRWKPRALTTRYQLYEAEMTWLDTKELMSGMRRERGGGGPVIVM